MSKSKPLYSDGPRLIGIGLMATGIIYFIFFLVLVELFGLTSIWDPLPFLFFILVFAMGLLLATNQIRVKPYHQQLQYCRNCHRALSRDELLGIWYCSSCQSGYESNLGHTYGLTSPRACPMCQRPLALDERQRLWFCHHCKKKYETRMLEKKR